MEKHKYFSGDGKLTNWYRQNIFKSNAIEKMNMYQLFCLLSELFLFLVVESFLRKDIKRKEMGFYPPLFRNSLEKWQKSEYPLIKSLLLKQIWLYLLVFPMNWLLVGVSKMWDDKHFLGIIFKIKSFPITKNTYHLKRMKW